MSDFSYEPIGQWVLTKGGHAYAKDVRGGPYVYLASHAHHGVFKVDHTGDLDDETIENLIQSADYNPKEPDLSNAVWEKDMEETILGKECLAEDRFTNDAAGDVMREEQRFRGRFDALYGDIELGRMKQAIDQYVKATGNNELGQSLRLQFQYIADTLTTVQDLVDEFQFDVSMNLQDE